MDTRTLAFRVGGLTTIAVVGAFVLVAVDRTGLIPPLRTVTNTLYYWVLLLGAAVLLLGVFNVLWIHLKRIQRGDRGWTHSLALVAAALTVIVAGLINSAGVAAPLPQWAFTYVLFPGQATLFAMLAFFMTAAAFRFLRIGRQGGGWMLTGALLVLLTQMPGAAALWPDSLRNVTIWLVDQPVMAAMRGAVLGTSLALMIAGVRLLAGRG